MIKCKNCGKENRTLEPVCGFCASEFVLSEKEALPLLIEAKENIERQKYIEAVDLYKFLAQLGITEAMREFAFILERGILVPRDLDMAMQYYLAAAKNRDSYSAYRYSKLISRFNGHTSDFWLEYSAILGEREAFSDAVSLYDRIGDESSAAYYCSRLAEEGDADAIVEMARRHLYGKGVEKDEGYARWYMDRSEERRVGKECAP